MTLTSSPNCKVSNVRKSVQYYTELLGFELLETIEESGECNWAMLRSGSTILMLEKVPTKQVKEIVKSKKQDDQVLRFEHENVNELYNKIKNKVKIIRQIETSVFDGMMDFMIRDIDGYLLSIGESR